MSSSITWIEIDPVDTLFFRGAESMEAGENHEVDTMFPPMPSTIIGAIRTAILGQRGLSPVDYLEEPEKWTDKYPLLGTPGEPGFDLSGPFIIKESGILLLPVPAHWYGALPEKMKWEEDYEVQAAAPLKSNSLGLCGSVSNPFWVHQPAGKDMKPLAGYWTTGKAFKVMRKGKGVIRFTKRCSQIEPDQAAILSTDSLYVREERLGIALSEQHTAKEGHLYSAGHVRLREGIRIVAGINSSCEQCLDEEGIVQLGGEQRICRYRLRKDIDLPENPSGDFLFSMTAIPLDRIPAAIRDKPRASGKLVRIGGWDMQKKFHKPMAAWLPAGTVFDKQGINIEAPQFLSI